MIQAKRGWRSRFFIPQLSCLGRKGWELVLQFYYDYPDYVTEMKSQLNKQKLYDWEGHFEKVKKKYQCYLEDAQCWNGYDDWGTLGKISEIQEIIQKISKI